MLNELNKDELIQINGGIFGVSEWADRIIRSTVRTVADAKMWIDGIDEWLIEGTLGYDPRDRSK